MGYRIKRFSWIQDKRSEWADELAKSMKEDLQTNIDASKKFFKAKGISDPKLSKRLDPGDEVAVFNIPSSVITKGKVTNSSFATNIRTLQSFKGKKKVLFPTKTIQAWQSGTPEEQEWAKEAIRLEQLLRESDSHPFIIVRDPNTKGLEVDAHEMGHVKRFGKFSFLPVLLLRLLGFDISFKGVEKLSEYVKRHRTDSFFTMLRHYLASYGIQTDEAKASEEAIEILRQAGASDRQIKVAKKNLGLAGKTYKIEDISWKAPLYWKLQTSNKLDKKHLRETFPDL